MSPLRTERLSIALCPDRVAVARTAGFLRRSTTTIERETQSTDQVSLWGPAVDALAQWLEEAKLPPACARIVLSNRFARFALVPWSENVQGPEEEGALARARLESQYGDMAAWAIQLDPGAYGQARIACAVEFKLLAALKSLFDAKRIRCEALEPYLVAGWNHWRRQLGNRDAIVALIESGSAVMACIKQRQWHSLRAVRAEGDINELQRLLARELLLQGWSDTVETYIDAPGWSLEARDTEAKFHWLSQVGPAGSAAMQMLSTGARA